MYGIALNTRRPPFDRAALRQAMILAFDFEWTNATLYHDAYTRTRSHFDNAYLGALSAPDDRERALLAPYIDRIPPEDLAAGYQPPVSDGSGRNRANLRKALGLLREAGFKVENDTLIDTATGEAFSPELVLVDPREERLAVTYADSLARLGIRLRVQTVDTAQFQRRLIDFDFDMVIHRWRMSLSPGNEQEHYWSSAAADRPGSRNYPGIRSDAVDAMISKLTGARDPEDFTAAARALDRLLLAGRYVVPLFHLNADRLAWQAGLRRPEVTPTYGFTLDTWWWDPSAVTR